MKQIKLPTSTQQLVLEQTEKIPFEFNPPPKSNDEFPQGSGDCIRFPETNTSHEKPPIGIETCMVYIAIPISLVMWIGILYIIQLLFF